MKSVMAILCLSFHRSEAADTLQITLLDMELEDLRL